MVETPARVEAKGGRRLRWIGLALLAVLVAIGAYYYLPRGADAQPEAKGRAGKGGRDGGRPTPVAVAPATLADVDIVLSGLGTITPLTTVTVRTRVEGQLMRVHFREGQVVKAGELLAEIDPRQFQVQLAQAQGQFQRDEALLANARLDLERYRTLFAQDSGSKQQLDTQAALVKQYEGALKIDQSQVDNARLQIDYSRITAPIAGRLGLRQVDPGNIVRAGDANGLVVITQLDPIGVVFTLPEDNVPVVMTKLRAGEKLRVEAYDRAGKQKLSTGSLITLDNQIDPTTGSVKVKAQFENDDLRLFPSQFVNARLFVDVRRGAVVIPAPAVQRGAQGSFVYLVKPDRTVTVRQVKLGPVQGQSIMVEEGVAAGDQVVIDGAERLREGSSVELASNIPAPSGPGRSAEGARKGGPGGRQGGGGGQRPGGKAEGAREPAGGAPAASPEGAASPRSDLFTPAELDANRERVRNASPEDRPRIRAEIRALAEKRAKEKGITLPPPGARGSGGG